MIDIDFDCTQCGKCCHDLKLPLTAGEAAEWLRKGHQVQILCEAVPWPVEPPESDRHAWHKRRRSFPAMSGSLPTRVVAILAANFAGACPHLMADMRCGIYGGRPLVCRIYPAEISPFIELRPSAKSCPDDAWASGGSALMRRGVLVDAGLRALVQQSRDADEKDAPLKQSLCAALGIDVAAMANEGFAIHSPDQATLLNQLSHALINQDRPAPAVLWRIVSNRRATVDAVARAGGVAMHADSVGGHPFKYVTLFPSSE